MTSEIYFKVISPLEEKLIEPIYYACYHQLGYGLWDMIARNCDIAIFTETPPPIKQYSRDFFKGTLIK
jgi:hypothetical protein